MSWKPASFKIAVPPEPRIVAGYEYRGLGLHMSMRPSPKGQRPPTWDLSHLNSGHRVLSIKGNVADAFPIATEIAECGDWTFDGLDGWRNVEPELPEKVVAIAARYAKRCTLRGAGGHDEPDHEMARTICANRTA